MKKSKENSGVTLIALIITVIVIIILSSIAIRSGRPTLKYTDFVKVKSQMEIMQTNVNKWSQEYASGKEEVLNYGEEIVVTDYSKIFNKLGISNAEAASYRLFTEKSLEELNINGMDKSFLVSIQNKDVLLAKPINYQETEYCSLESFGFTKIQSIPIDFATFELASGINTTGKKEYDIFVKNLKFYDSTNNEVDISKFIVEYSNDGQNWNTAIEKSNLNFEEKASEEHFLPVNTSGTYEVKIKDSNGTQLGDAQTITISKIPDYWKIAKEDNSDGWYSYSDAEGKVATVNAPKLADGMLPITYKGNDDTTYETLTTGSKWANAMTKDGSMWVWIPRYAYQITSGYHMSGDDINPSDGTQGAGTIKIAFLKGNTNNFLDKNLTYAGHTVITNPSEEDPTEIYNNPNSKKWILAPGFTFGDAELEGFWAAKFEASNTMGYGDSAETADNANLTLQVKPNVTSWRSISAANIFTVCYNLKNKKDSNNNLIYFNQINNVDTHMMKNVEWGAIAYLAHSTYGLNGQKIGANKSSGYITGHANTSDEYNTASAINTSTTKNIYGIYDMSGGAWEKVSTILENKVGELSTDTSNTEKYIDIFSYTNEKYGDALYETSNDSNSWLNNGLFKLTQTNYLAVRGGYIGGTNGLFRFSIESGNNNSHGRLPPNPCCILIKILFN